MEDKVQNKVALYVESILYIILITFVIFLNIYGDIYVRTIPLLFFLGMAGKMVYDRPVITSVFSIIVSFILLFIHGSYDVYQTLLFCLYMTAIVVLGELTSSLILKIYDKNKKVIKLSKTKEIVIILSIVIIVVFSLFVHSYMSGNIFEYSYKKSRLKQYVIEKYMDKLDSSKIDDSLSEYHSNTYVYYVIADNGEKYKFSINNEGKIDDGYKNKIIEENNSIISSKFQEFLEKNNISSLYKNYLFDIRYIDAGEYLDVQVTIQKTYLSQDTTHTDETTKEFAKELKDIFRILQEFDEYEKISYAKISLVNKPTDNEDMLNILQTTIYKDSFNSGEEYLYSLLIDKK